MDDSDSDDSSLNGDEIGMDNYNEDGGNEVYTDKQFLFIVGEMILTGNETSDIVNE